MVPASTVSAWQNRPSQNDCPCLRPHGGGATLPPASLGDSCKSAEVPTKFLLLPQRPGARESLCVPFQSGVYVPQPSRTPERKPCWPSQSDTPGAPVPSVGPLTPGAQCGAQTSDSCRRSSAAGVLPFVGCPPRVMRLDCILTSSLLPISLWFLFIFSCISFLVESGLFHQ